MYIYKFKYNYQMKERTDIYSKDSHIDIPLYKTKPELRYITIVIRLVKKFKRVDSDVYQTIDFDKVPLQSKEELKNKIIVMLDRNYNGDFYNKKFKIKVEVIEKEYSFDDKTDAVVYGSVKVE